MRILRCGSKEQLALDAALAGAERIGRSIHKRGEATIVLACGMSQTGMLEHLVAEDLDWGRVTAFHLDEYVGLKGNHPGSFRTFLKERFVDKVNLAKFHPIQGEKNPVTECRRLSKLIADLPIDVAFVGIGENGHLAFNDPPADFEAVAPYRIVKLDKDCKRQQVKEGWFGTVAQVPSKAISMSIPQILSAESIICTVPDKRKAEAVQAALEGDITPWVPASILQTHRSCHVYLDPESGAMLGPSRKPMVVKVPQLEDAPHPLVTGVSRFHLFIAGDWRKHPESDLAQFARRVVGSGAVTVTTWGSNSFALKLAVEAECARRTVSGTARGGARQVAAGHRSASVRR